MLDAGSADTPVSLAPGERLQHAAARPEKPGPSCVEAGIKASKAVAGCHASPTVRRATAVIDKQMRLVLVGAFVGLDEQV